MTPALAPAACLATAWQVAPDLLLRLVVIAGLMGLAGWSSAQRHFPGRRAFTVLTGALAVWIAGTTAEHAAVDAACKSTLALLAWPLILLQAPLWLLFVRQYAGQASPAGAARRWGLVATGYGVLSLAAISNGAHGLLYGADTRLGPPVLGLPRMHYAYGPLFYASVAWVYGWLLAAAWIIVRTLRASTPSDRRQWIAFALVMLGPWLANVAYIGFGLRLFGADPTPLSFALTVAGFGWLIRSSSLLSMVPLSRGLLFSALPDPVLVLDELNRVVDCNAASHRLAGATLPPGRPLAEWPVYGQRLAELLARAEPTSGTLVLDGQERVFDVQLRDIGSAPRRIGRLLQLRDVTERHRTQMRLTVALAQRDERLQQVAQLEAELREQTLRDPLTGLLNRRALLQRYAQAQAAGGAAQPLSLAVLDLDHFKSINDGFGHAVGDAVLLALGRALVAGLPAGDAVFRIGGEEFALLMRNTDGAQALQRLQVLQQRAAVLPLRPDGVAVTFSAGVAVNQVGAGSLDDLLHRADAALYAAKAAGRNRCMLADAASALPPH